MQRSLAVLLALSLTVVAGTFTRTARFGPDDLVFSSDKSFDIVDVRGYPSLGRPGEPLLPVAVERVVVPAGAVVTGVELLDAEWQELNGSYNIGPAQPDVILPRPGVPQTVDLVGPDPAVYGSTAPFPASVIRVLASGTMSGYRIAHVELRPVRWSPATGRLELATRLRYRLSYGLSGVGNAVATERQQEEFGRSVRQLVVNPDDVDRCAPRVRRSTVTTLPPGDYEYVILTEAPMDTVFERLAEWKTQKGVPATVVLVSWVATNYTGYDLQEKLRNFLKDAHQTWGTMYALLGGSGDYNTSGQNIFPTRMANYIGNEPCDLYYGGLDGTWDANNNHTYGEIADSVDMYSDVYVGRASVYSVAMAQNFVAKTIAYEQDPPSGFIRRMLLPTAILWSSYEERPMVESIARMTGPAWQDGRLYERAGTLSRQATNDSLNDGWGMSHWDGHGSETGIYMGSSPFFTADDALAMTNDDKTGMAIAIACDCAAWDMVSGGDCLAENMVNATGGGFVASIMNTRYGYGAIGPGGNYVPGPSERLDTTFYAGVLSYGMPRTGQALGYSKATWAPYADSLYQYAKQRWCIYGLNLIGDPETPLWTDEPTDLTVSHAGVITLGNGVPYDVTITDPGAAPVESALVVLRKGEEVNLRGWTNSSGQVTLLVSALTPGPMMMAVSSHNHRIAFDTVMVIASERYVSHLRSWTYDPAPGGNNDSILNPGETVSIPTWVKNWGQQTALSVTAKLLTHDAHAEVTDSMKTFGSIAAGDSAYTGLAGFGLRVDSGLANGYAVACSLICRDANDSTWVSNLTYCVGTATLAGCGMVVADTARGGNGNGRIDPGETVDLGVAIRNGGLGHGYNCRAKLRSGDVRLQVLDSLVMYGTVRKGDTVWSGADPFTVHADAGIPPETPMSCTLHLLADGCVEAVEELVVVVGEFRVVDPIPDGPRQPAAYWAYDECDTGYTRHPEFEWVEINGVGTQITFSQNDAVVMVPLPGPFGPLKYYGQRYTQVSVSADGWIACGNYTTSDYSNDPLPGSAAPPAVIALNWDDLYPSYNNQNHVYWYHDAANHRFVIEYDSVPYYANRTMKDKFELVIYDTTLAAADGQNQVLCQYLTGNDYSSSTLGLQDETRQIGIECLYNASYHRGCPSIAAGRAILYTTDEPITGVAEEQLGPAGIGPARFGVWPNPTRAGARLRFGLAAGADVRLSVYDRAGREVRRLLDGRLERGEHRLTWNGLDAQGRRLAQGVYFVRLAIDGQSSRQKLVVTD